MHSIKMNRIELLEIVRENARKHIVSYFESVSDYKVAVMTITKENLKLAKTEDLESFKKIKSIPAAPKSYEDKYQKAIRMLELSVEDVIEVDDTIFNQLVLDEWAWKNDFISASVAYKSFA